MLSSLTRVIHIDTGGMGNPGVGQSSTVLNAARTAMNRGYAVGGVTLRPRFQHAAGAFTMNGYDAVLLSSGRIVSSRAIPPGGKTARDDLGALFTEPTQVQAIAEALMADVANPAITCLVIDQIGPHGFLQGKGPKLGQVLVEALEAALDLPEDEAKAIIIVALWGSDKSSSDARAMLARSRNALKTRIVYLERATSRTSTGLAQALVRELPAIGSAATPAGLSPRA